MATKIPKVGSKIGKYQKEFGLNGEISPSLVTLLGR